MFLSGKKFQPVYDLVHTALLDSGHDVDTGHWQAMTDVPMTKTRELIGVMMRLPIDPTVTTWADNVKPNLPWAEAHFMERVGGEPLNPGTQYKNWPWYRGNVEKHQTEAEQAFSHTYMERIWPRHVHDHGDGPVSEMQGIRYRYGDLKDVLDLLEREPHTRQAYLPIWFPEDTGAHHEQRVPCTLGYHFMLRNDELHVYYPMRSLDFLRYFRDDTYMAGRLAQWIIGELRKREQAIPENDPRYADPAVWNYATPGMLTMFAHSLHVFQGDLPKLERERPNA